MRTNPTRTCSVALVCLLATISASIAAEDQLAGQSTTNRFLLGGDISGLAKLEECHGTYRDKGQVGDLIAILSDNGCNCSRLRLFVDPQYKNLVVNDLPYTLALAKRVKQAGHFLLLDLHYSDTWADPGKQFTPAAWNRMSPEALERQVKKYTAEVISRFDEAGVRPDIVQIGNEITNGMLWPHGKIVHKGSESDKRESWDRFTRLLKAGVAGVESVADSPEIKIMLHIDRGGDWKRTKYFFDQLDSRRVKFDMIGQSFYPWWHGKLSDLKINLKETAHRYNKPIVVVETGYPHRGPQWSSRSNMQWPISPAGQAQFLQDVIETTQQTPNGLGAGVLYWYPEAIKVDGLHIWEGGSVGLFDESGSSLPALRSFLKRVPSTSSLETGAIR